ncbi:hypothetical protein JB92DRAFT_2609466, partial [Gautieria morchelliformis]
IEFAQVKFYFSAQINNVSKALALVQLYSCLDLELLKLSIQTVYSVTQMNEDNGLRVIDAKSIHAVVSIQPHKHPGFPEEERYFLWEQLGLDM